MKKIILKCILLVVLFVAVALPLGIVFNNIPLKYEYPKGSTKSVLLRLDEPKDYDLMFLGSSHAHYMMREVNHAILEDSLGATIADISQPGAGIVPAAIYAEYFFNSGNTCSNAVFFIDGFSFFSRKYNEEKNFLNQEPLDLLLLEKAIDHHMTYSILYQYYQTKFRHEWYQLKPKVPKEIVVELGEVKKDARDQHVKNLFPDGMDEELSQHYVNELLDLILILKENHCKVTFVMPPTLMGTIQGDDFTLALLEKLKKEQGIAFADFTTTDMDGTMFIDYDHMNTKGAKHFVSNYLKPFFKEQGFLQDHDEQ